MTVRWMGCARVNWCKREGGVADARLSERQPFIRRYNKSRKNNSQDEVGVKSTGNNLLLKGSWWGDRQIDEFAAWGTASISLWR